MASQVQVPAEKPRVGIGHWMERVLAEFDKVGTGLAPDPVHDLRVAIRRCRSIGEVFRELDLHPAWQKMRKEGKAVFAPLGELRDVQVMAEWVDKLASSDVNTARSFRDLLAGRESVLKQNTLAALRAFDRDRWESWTKVLAKRADQVELGNAAFDYLALERWQDAHNLHRAAMRNRSRTAYHQLRIGLKKLRYLVENFLPERLEQWGDDLKHLQDLLGDVHDLDVLWEMAVKNGVFPDARVRTRWQTRIAAERKKRLLDYRKMMIGPASLWRVWREALPQGDDLQRAIMAKLKVWASFLDPDLAHSERVMRFSLELYDGLTANGLLLMNGDGTRRTLEAASVMHDVGREKGGAAHHKRSARLIENLATPISWRREDVLIAASVARYHRGALPRPDHKLLQQLSPEDRDLTRKLAGILRLADALDAAHDGAITNMALARNADMVVICAEGYDPQKPLAEKVAAARHLLETECGMPVFVHSSTTLSTPDA